MSRFESLAARFEKLTGSCHDLYGRWQARPDGSIAWPLAAKTAGAIMVTIVLGLGAIALGKTEMFFGRVRIWTLRRRLALLEATLNRDPYQVPRLGQALVCFFTPAKHRETAVLEMQIGYEFNVDSLGAPAARLAYWWEIARNTFAFCGGSKGLAALAGLGGLIVALWKLL